MDVFARAAGDEEMNGLEEFMFIDLPAMLKWKVEEGFKKAWIVRYVELCVWCQVLSDIDKRMFDEDDPLRFLVYMENFNPFYDYVFEKVFPDRDIPKETHVRGLNIVVKNLKLKIWGIRNLIFRGIEEKAMYDTWKDVELSRVSK